MAWKTFQDNGIQLVFPTGESNSLRVVFDDHIDIAYVVPTGVDNGNGNARLIAAAPKLWNACRLMWAAVADCGCKVPPQVLEAAKNCRRACADGF